MITDSNEELAGLENETDQLRSSIKMLEEAARREAETNHRARSDGSLMAMRNRLMVVERRIEKIKFGPLRLV